MRDMKLVGTTSIRKAIWNRRKLILDKRPIRDRDRQQSIPRFISRHISLISNYRMAIDHSLRTRRATKIRAASDRATVGITEAIGTVTDLFEIQKTRLENEKAIEYHRPLDRFDRKRERKRRYQALEMTDRQCIQELFQNDLRPNKWLSEILDTQDDSPATAQNDSNQQPYAEADDRAKQFWDKFGPQQLGITDIVDPIDKARKLSQTARKLEQAMKSVARHDRQHRLIHAVRTTRTAHAARVLNPKTRQQPEGHPFIVDQDSGKTRRCRTNEEILQATREVHTKWTGPSAAKKQFFFGSFKNDSVGPNRLSDPPVNEFQESDVPDFLPDHDKYDERIIQRFIDAHRNLKELFAATSQTNSYPNEALLWPFYIDPKTGKIHDDGFEQKFWKSVIPCPSKARHGQFHLAFFGRMPKKWGQAMYKALLLALILRFIPRGFKPGDRTPIPKSIPGESRPLTTLHDCFCILSSEIGQRLLAGLEKTLAIPDEAIAFRKGKGCDDITHLIIGLKQDAIESMQMIAFNFEDEEKFYDRVLAELQACGLRAAGLPECGYIEFKIEDMYERFVNVRTRQGTIRIPFIVGLFQGSMLSVVISNIVTAFKFKAWKLIDQPGYMPATYDDRDKETLSKSKPWAKGYCDDNTVFFGLPEQCSFIPEYAPSLPIPVQLFRTSEIPCSIDQQLQNLIPFADYQLPAPVQLRRAKLRWILQQSERSIRLTGDLSLVTKLGRKGSKSEIHILNVHPDDRDLVPDCIESIAWSFQLDGIATEKVPVKAHFSEHGIEIIGTPEHSEDALADISGPDTNESAPESTASPPRHRTSIQSARAATDIEYFDSDRQLGLYSTIDGTTDDSTSRILKKTTERMHELKLYKVRGQALPFAINILLDPIISYAPLLQGLQPSMLTVIDEHLTKQIHSICGLSSTDNKAMMYISKEQHGLGIKPLSCTHIINTARECEVLLNDTEMHAIIARGRYKAGITLRDSLDAFGDNYIMDAVRMLGFFGIYIRDSRFFIFDRWVNKIATSQGAYCIGHPDNQDDGAPHITNRKCGNKAEAFASGQPIYMALKQTCIRWMQENPELHWTNLRYAKNWIGGRLQRTRVIPGLPRRQPIPKTIAASALDATINSIDHDLNSLYSVLEWRRPLDNWRDPWTDTAGWHQLTIDPIDWAGCDFDDQDTHIHRHTRNFIEKTRLSMHHPPEN